VGAVLAGEKTAEILQVSDHGSTFGGNPIAAAAGLVVLETVNDPGFLAGIRGKGERFKTLVQGWNHPHVKDIRGRGLMLAVDIDGEAWPILEKGVALASDSQPGLLLLSAGKNTLRFLPPYIIGDGEIDQGLDMLKGLLDQ
jgi:acetylornithine/N-succinyldiaminopimelate aminotransferase